MLGLCTVSVVFSTGVHLQGVRSVLLQCAQAATDRVQLLFAAGMCVEEMHLEGFQDFLKLWWAWLLP